MSHVCFHPSFGTADLRFIIGVDGGGTGTRVRLWTSEGALVGSVGVQLADRVGPDLRRRLVAPRGDGIDGAHRVVRQQLLEALA